MSVIDAESLSPLFPVLAAMADLAAFHTELQALGVLAARLEENRVAVSVAVELFQGRVLDGRTAAGAGVAAGGAEVTEAGRAGLQETQEQLGALAVQAGQQQVKPRVCRRHTAVSQTTKRHVCEVTEEAAGCSKSLRKRRLTTLLTLN